VGAAAIDARSPADAALLGSTFVGGANMCHDASEDSAKRNGDVGVVDEQIVMTRQGSELNQRAHLAIGAEALRAFY